MYNYKPLICTYNYNQRSRLKDRWVWIVCSSTTCWRVANSITSSLLGDKNVRPNAPQLLWFVRLHYAPSGTRQASGGDCFTWSSSPLRHAGTSGWAELEREGPGLYFLLPGSWVWPRSWPNEGWVIIFFMGGLEFFWLGLPLRWLKAWVTF